VNQESVFGAALAAAGAAVALRFASIYRKNGVKIRGTSYPEFGGMQEIGVGTEPGNLPAASRREECSFGFILAPAPKGPGLRPSALPIRLGLDRRESLVARYLYPA